MRVHPPLLKLEYPPVHVHALFVLLSEAVASAPLTVRVAAQVDEVHAYVNLLADAGIVIPREFHCAEVIGVPVARNVAPVSTLATCALIRLPSI